MAMVGRLVVLLAVLLMPFGMEPSAATGHEGAMMGMTMEHCPDQSMRQQHSDGLATCSMACSSALPAQELVRDEGPVRIPQLVLPSRGHALHGILPEIATPPPRFA
jgi:hypothetical protein